MKQLLEDVLEVLNALPNRKLRGKDWTTYDLAKRVENKLQVLNTIVTLSDLLNDIKQDETTTTHLYNDME